MKRELQNAALPAVCVLKMTSVWAVTSSAIAMSAGKTAEKAY